MGVDMRYIRIKFHKYVGVLYSIFLLVVMLLDSSQVGVIVIYDRAKLDGINNL